MTDPATPFNAQFTPYESLGGEPAVRGLVEAFYDRMEAEPAYAVIRALHPVDLSSSREKLFMFLSGWLGGPGLYIAAYGHPRLRGRHMPFPIGTTERDQWLGCMSNAMDQCGIDGDVRAFLDQRFAHVANFMRNRDDC